MERPLFHMHDKNLDGDVEAYCLGLDSTPSNVLDHLHFSSWKVSENGNASWSHSSLVTGPGSPLVWSALVLFPPPDPSVLLATDRGGAKWGHRQIKGSGQGMSPSCEQGACSMPSYSMQSVQAWALSGARSGSAKSVVVSCGPGLCCCTGHLAPQTVLGRSWGGLCGELCSAGVLWGWKDLDVCFGKWNFEEKTFW